MKKSSLKGLTSSNIAASSSASCRSTSVSSTTPATTTTINTTTTTTTSVGYDNDNIIIRKIENAVEGLSSDCFNYLAKRVLPGSETGKENTLTILKDISSLLFEL